MQLAVTASVGVVGSGTMGSGIAQIAAQAGHPVLLLDAQPGRAQAAIDGITDQLNKLVAKGRISSASAAAATANLRAATTNDDLADCGLIIEAAVEALKIKRSIFTALESVVSETCILATNTSSLSVTAVAATLQNPARFVGMHFFNPAPVMKLVEVVSGLATDPAVAATVADTAAAWGKSPIHVTSTPGFVVNRVARPFYGEALRALEERAADAATIDAIMRESGGFRMGPLELTDLIGQDVNLAVSRTVWELFGFDPRYAPSLAQQALVDAGRLGRKSGHGFYAYGDAEAIQPKTAPTAPRPKSVDVQGDWGPWAPLWERLVQTVSGSGDPVAKLSSGAIVVPTDGRTGTERAVESGTPTIVIDLALNPSTATRFAIAAAHNCAAEHVAEAVGLLQATGASVTVIDDIPGLLVARTVAMLVNEAADVVGRGAATAADVDTAMRLGTGYPLGPLEWSDRVGAARVVTILDALARGYGDGRYRACMTLRRAAWAACSLTNL